MLGLGLGFLVFMIMNPRLLRDICSRDDRRQYDLREMYV